LASRPVVYAPPMYGSPYYQQPQQVVVQQVPVPVQSPAPQVTIIQSPPPAAAPAPAPVPLRAAYPQAAPVSDYQSSPPPYYAPSAPAPAPAAAAMGAGGMAMGGMGTIAPAMGGAPARGPITCAKCTYVNEKPGIKCGMCGADLPKAAADHPEPHPELPVYSYVGPDGKTVYYQLPAGAQVVSPGGTPSASAPSAPAVSHDPKDFELTCPQCHKRCTPTECSSCGIKFA